MDLLIVPIEDRVCCSEEWSAQDVCRGVGFDSGVTCSEVAGRTRLENEVLVSHLDGFPVKVYIQAAGLVSNAAVHDTNTGTILIKFCSVDVAANLRG